jgi:hypothetical protein
MTKSHTVAEDEHLPRIAAKYGFPSMETIWNHPQNEKLKNLRKDPNILFAGDEVFIPDLETKQLDAETDKRHRFELSLAGLELHVKVNDLGFQPIHGEASLTEASGNIAMRQKGDIFEADVPPDAAKGVLDFPLSKTQRQRPSITLQIGRLDPLDTLSGQQQRLNNLGYFAGFVPPSAVEIKRPDSQFRWAVEEFQRDHMGEQQVDGVLGPNTLQKLKKVYGC